MLNNYICALDIGSSKLAACVAEIKRKSPKKLFFESLPSRGVERGIIVNSIDLVSSITKLIKHLKIKSGINIKFIHTNISGPDIVSRHSRAIVPLIERGNKEITISDIEKVNEQARILGSSLEDEIIHMIPSSYTIDSKDNVANPLGLYSHRLEVDLYLLYAKLSSVQALRRVISQSGYEMQDLFFSGLATSKVVFDRGLSEGLNLFYDIGRDTTELLLFRDGLLMDTEILPIGGDDLTKELEEALKIPFELAEDIKRSYGIIGDPEQIPEDKGILVKKSSLYKPIKQRLVSEIVTAKAKSICAEIKEAVGKKVSPYEVNNCIIVGRTVLLEGFIEMLENHLSIPVKLGRITNPEVLSLVQQYSALSGQKYLTYLTCLGMICQALQDKQEGLPGNQAPKNFLLKLANRFKEIYQGYF